jgi:hypothetical protein
VEKAAQRKQVLYEGPLTKKEKSNKQEGRIERQVSFQQIPENASTVSPEHRWRLYIRTLYNAYYVQIGNVNGKINVV